ncbi:unnamed protein product, partial [Amoebophrya sp. A120]
IVLRVPIYYPVLILVAHPVCRSGRLCSSSLLPTPDLTYLPKQTRDALHQSLTFPVCAQWEHHI